MSERSTHQEHDDISPLLGRIVMEDTDPRQFDQSFVLMNPYQESTYRIEDNKITVADAIWGELEIGREPGDEVFLELVGHPVMQRLQGIEQLTLPKEMTTIPGTAGFTRWEHAWGSLALTRKLGQQHGLEPDVLRKKELRALLSDSSQWAFSHLGDWIFQGSGGSEDAHDHHQYEFLERTGIGDVLTRHGYSLDELMVVTDDQDWVECSAPDLCVDRVDFGSREMMRWISRTPELATDLKGFPFSVDENDKLVVDSLDTARRFTKAFMLLSTEHWQEPVHRLQLALLQEMIKHNLIQEEPLSMHPIGEMYRYHPRDYLMSVDHDFTPGMHTVDSLPWILYELTSEIGKSRRLIHRMVRSSELEGFMADDRAPLPDPVVASNWQGRHHPLTPPNIDIIYATSPNDVRDFMQNPNSIDIFLPGLKPRIIDPLFRDSKGVTRRLSNSDPYSAELLSQQRTILERSYVARIYMNGEYRQHIINGIAENIKQWPKLLSRPRMPNETFNDSFRWATGLGVAWRKTHVEWWR